MAVFDLAAVQSVLDAVAGLARLRAEFALDRMVGASFLGQGSGIQALQLAVEPLARARSAANRDGGDLPAAFRRHLPTLSEDLVARPEMPALLQRVGLLAAALAGKLKDVDSLSDALADVEKLANAMAGISDSTHEAAGMAMLACATALCNSGSAGRRDALRAASAALRAARGSASESALLGALEAAIRTSLILQDPDEAASRAEDAAQLATKSGDEATASECSAIAARAHVACGDACRASAALKGRGEDAGNVAVASAEYDIGVFLGNCEQAAAAGKRLEGMAGGGDKRTKAAAFLLQGGVSTSLPEALACCQKAVALFEEMKDATSVSSAKLMAANAAVSGNEKGGNECLELAQAALSGFRAAGKRDAEAAALGLVAAALLDPELEQHAEAQEACRQAAGIFRELKQDVGSVLTARLLRAAQEAVSRTIPATVDLGGASGIAQVELPEGLSPESLRGVVDELRAADGLSCIVLHVGGGKKPPTTALPLAGKEVGMFLMGLRAVGVPTVAAVCRDVAGPLWAFVLACDYRIGATPCTFLCPPWGKPESLGPLISHSAAVQMCMTQGPKDSLIMLENGVLHQLQRDTADTREAALQMAKRVAATSAMACRRQPHVLGKHVGEYAQAAIQGVAC